MMPKQKRVRRRIAGPTARATEMSKPYKAAKVRTGIQSAPNTRSIFSMILDFFESGM